MAALIGTTMYYTHSSEDTFAFGQALGACLQKGDSVLLYGDLGTGKSVLARGCARALGVTDAMASPTFTLMQPYRGTALPVYHFDLYRISSADELFAAGLEESIGGDGVALIEWPQQGDVCPDTRVELDLTRGRDIGDREIELTCFLPDGREAFIRNALSKWEVRA